MRSAITPIPVDLVPSSLDYVAVWATAVAAAVTAITAVFIWLQIRQTQRSVKATEQTLTLAREEQEQNRKLIVNAQKSRIDAELPKVLVWVTRQPDEADTFGELMDFDFGTDQYVARKPDPVWSLPRDESVTVAIEVIICVSNDGPRRARVTMVGNGEPIQLFPRDELIIPVGEQSSVRIKQTLTLAQWLDMADACSSWEPLTLTYTHQGTEGAIEQWAVLLSGNPLVPVLGEPNAWKLGRDLPSGFMTHLVAEITMPHREYYSSMSDRTVLA